VRVYGFTFSAARRCPDSWVHYNIFTERLWRTVKYEEVYLHCYGSPREARQSLARYFQFYNQQRPHQALGYQTPAALYFATRSAATAGDDSGKGGESAFCVSPTPSVS
jgi:Integrase core domain